MGATTNCCPLLLPSWLVLRFFLTFAFLMRGRAMFFMVLCRLSGGKEAGESRGWLRAG